MPNLTKNKKIIIGSISIFLVLAVAFIINIPSANAASFLDVISKPGEFVMEILAWGAYGILWIVSRLISVAAFLLEAVFRIESSTGFTKVTVVTSGWEITRGLCNMFFALILLLMAFDTILQTNKFPIKNILPRLIIVALTINFSLMFLGIIIDFSQVLTNYFITAAGGSSGSIADQLANGLNIAKVFQVDTGLSDTDSLQSKLGGGTASLMAIFGTLVFGIIIILIAAFALAAGAIFMLIRLVSLWVLLILSPLAWLAMITPIPGLSSLTSNWWEKFFKWTFFAPIYSFFIYLAVLIAGTPIFNVVQTEAQKEVVGNMFINGFLSSSNNGIGLLMQYIVIIALLLMGLKVASESGLVGAGAVVNWGKKAGDKLKSGAKRWSGAQWAYDNATAGATKMAGNMFGNTRLGRRLRAKGVGMETKGEGREQNKAYANNLKTMSDMDLQEEVIKAFGIKKLLAARHAKERGLLAKTDKKDVVQKAMATFGAYGVKNDKSKKTKEQEDLEDIRFDALGLDPDKKEDKEKLEEIIERSKENGSLEKIKSVVLEDKQIVSIMNGKLKHEFGDVYKKWGNKNKETVKETMLKSFTSDVSGKNESQIRQNYAAITGEIGKAFAKEITKDENGKSIGSGGHVDELLKEYIDGLTAAKVAEIKGLTKKEDIGLIGQYASERLANDLGRDRNASAEQKAAFADGVKKGANEAAKKIIEQNPGWGGSAPTKKTAEVRGFRQQPLT